MIASMKWAEHPTTCCPFENSTSRGMIRTLPRGRGRSYHKLPPEHRAAHIQMLTVTSSRCFSRLCLALGLLSITRRPMLSFWIPSCIFWESLIAPLEHGMISCCIISQRDRHECAMHITGNMKYSWYLHLPSPFQQRAESIANRRWCLTHLVDKLQQWKAKGTICRRFRLVQNQDSFSAVSMVST